METHNSLVIDCSPFTNIELAEFVCRRRESLQLTYDQAAKLAGISIYEWMSLEEGTVGSMCENMILTIAGTLEVSSDDLRILVESDQR